MTEHRLPTDRDPARPAPREVQPVSAPPDIWPAGDDEGFGETPIEAKVRLARAAEADPADPADRRRRIPELQASRLSPPVLLILVALALALIALLVVFGGLI